MTVKQTITALAGSIIGVFLFTMIGCDDPAPPTPGGGDTMGLGANWMSYGRDRDNSRHATDGLINSGNVRDLRIKFDLTSGGSTSNAVVEDGIIYWTDYNGQVHATREDGSEVWRTQIPVEITASVTIDGNRLFFGDSTGVLHCLDKRNGAVIWTTELDSHPHAYIWGSPSVIDGIVIIGVGADGTRSRGDALPWSVLEGLQGSVHGVDAATGKKIWRWTPNVGPYGRKFSDGNAVWSTCAIDPELGVCYIGTGNAWQQPPSPYTDALVALEVHTGALKWARSYTPDDVWRSGDCDFCQKDSDVGAAPNLFAIDGRPVVGVPDKAGNYTVHDRVTGEIIWQRKNIRSPTVLGGFISSAAYADGKLFLAGNNLIFSSRMYALDARTGRTLWDVENGGTFTIAAPAVSGNVVFSGDANGEIKAYDVSNGNVLWTSQLPEGRGSDFTISGGMMIVGTGFHFFDSTAPLGVPKAFPIPGGLRAYALPR